MKLVRKIMGVFFGKVVIRLGGVLKIGRGTVFNYFLLYVFFIYISEMCLRNGNEEDSKIKNRKKPLAQDRSCRDGSDSLED